VTTGNIWGGTIPAGTTSSLVARANGIQFKVNSACQITAIGYWVDATETSLLGSNYAVRLYSTTVGTDDILITSAAGSGTFTAGAWNWIPITPFTPTVGASYVAVVDNPNLLTFEHNFWAPAGPQGPITAGPLTVPSGTTALGGLQQPFGTTGAFPSSINNSFYGIDVTYSVSGGGPAPASGLLLAGLV
jgi:hypothetical protein